MFLDNTPEIVKWSSETTIIPYFDPVSQKDRRYFMDFTVQAKQSDGSLKTLLIELKPYKQTLRPRANRNKSERTILNEVATYATNKAKWDAAAALCKKMGWTFLIWTEKDLFAGIDKGFKRPRAK